MFFYRGYHKSEFDGINCKLYVSFGSEEKVGDKWKTTENMMSWKSPFCYDNTKKHLIGQHPDRWKDDLKLSNGAKDTLFEGAMPFRNRLQYNFTKSSWGERAIVFDLNKEIVEVII